MNKFPKQMTLIFMFFLLPNFLYAELPYESNHDHTFVLTSGKSWYSQDITIINQQQSYNRTLSYKATPFSLQYIFHNKFTIGLSYRNLHSSSMSGDTGLPDSNNNLLGTVHGGTFYTLKESSYINLFTQIKPLNYLEIKPPVSFSLFLAVQDVFDEKYFIVTGYIYKKFLLNKKHSIQPILSIGYREISSSSSANVSSIAASMIYSLSIHKDTDILIIPRVNDFSGVVNYSVQVGISHGL